MRQSYSPGWQFPGGGVERNEHLMDALGRELLEETGIAISRTPKLHGIFSNFQKFKGDRVVVYVIEDWKPVAEPSSKLEIVGRGFFPIDLLSTDLNDGARRCLSEVCLKARSGELNWLRRRHESRHGEA